MPAKPPDMKRIPEFVRFLAAGGFAALCNILSRVLFSLVLPFETAVILAYMVGMTVAYLLMRRFVFNPSGKLFSRDMARFILVNMLGMLQVFVVADLLYRIVLPWLGVTYHPAEIAHVIGTGAQVFSSYVGHKYFSFAARRSKAV